MLKRQLPLENEKLPTRVVHLVASMIVFIPSHWHEHAPKRRDDQGDY